MRMLSVLAVLLAAVWSSLAGAQEAYPNRHITLVAPIAAGGPLDVNARLIATALSDVLGRQVVVENRPGAGTTVGTASVARAAPDGYTLLLADLSMVVGPSLVANLSYDPLRDFVPVALVSRSFMLLVVNPAFEAKSVSDVIALAKRRPGELQISHAGVGTPPHLAALVFTRAAGLNMTLVPYRGSSPAIADVVAGHIPMTFVGFSAAGPMVKTGQLRAIAVTGTQRPPSLPDVPTVVESGVDVGVLNGGSWFGIAVPKGTPAPIVEKLNAAVNQALQDPKVRARYEAADFVLAGGTPQEFGAFMQAQRTFWRGELEAAGLRPQ
jgi:tripartite-type tricarboxylate transporter receptor subunit TctC